MNIFIIGAGVVGSSIGKSLIDKGHKIIYVDINPNILKKLYKDGYTAIPPSEMDRFDADASIVSVPTPMNVDGSVDLRHVKKAVNSLARWLGKTGKKGHLIIIRSTILPYTTRQHIIPEIENTSGLSAGRDFYICYQPEFLRADSSLEDSKHPWAIVIGEYNKESGDKLVELYNGANAPIHRVDIETAEFVKYICNYFNALKISFSNEIWLLGRLLGLDSNKALRISSDVAEGFWNKQYGTMGGMPYGGTCLPKDTNGLYTLAQEKKFSMPILKAVIHLNSLMLQLSRIGLASEPESKGPNWKPSPNSGVKEGVE